MIYAKNRKSIYLFSVFETGADKEIWVKEEYGMK